VDPIVVVGERWSTNVGELGNSLRGKLSEVKVVLALDERSKGVLKTAGVTGNPTIEALGVVDKLAVMPGGTLRGTVVDANKLPDSTEERVIGVLVTEVVVNEMSDTSVAGTLMVAVVTERLGAPAGVLVTTVEVAAAVADDSTIKGVGTVSCSDLFVSIALVASIIALCTLSLKISA